MSNNPCIKIGRFVVRIGLRPDNPAFPVYLVFRRERLIGRQFSMPSLTDCEWLERTGGKYANQSEFAQASAELERRKRSATAGRNSSLRSNNFKKVFEAA